MLIINSGALRQGLGSARKHQNRERGGERERERERGGDPGTERQSANTERERARGGGEEGGDQRRNCKKMKEDETFPQLMKSHPS